MKDILSNSPQRLSEVNTLVATCNQDGFSFGRALSLSQFYRDFNDTNSLVKEAENLARENPARLLECSISLLSETDGYLSSDRSGLYAADFERIFEEHIKPFELRHEEAKSAATQLWRDYSAKSNCLDLLPLESVEYRLLDKECDAAKAEYDRAHALADLRKASLPTSRPVTVRPKENLRVCYMVFAVSRTIRPHERGKLWAEEFLKRCGISKSYYDKHRSDVCSSGTTEENREYRESVDRAIENARKLRTSP